MFPKSPKAEKRSSSSCSSSFFYVKNSIASSSVTPSIFFSVKKMASHFAAHSRVVGQFPPGMTFHWPLVSTAAKPLTRTTGVIWRVRAPNGGDSYLHMWKNAVDRNRKTVDFQKIADKSASSNNDEEEVSPEVIEKKSEEFQKILEVSKEERDRIQQMQVIDRAAAAIAAARALLSDGGPRQEEVNSGDSEGFLKVASAEGEDGGGTGLQVGGLQSGNLLVPRIERSGNATPGPDFWSWTPPLESDGSSDGFGELQTAKETLKFPNFSNTVEEKERTQDFLSIPLESELNENSHKPPFLPLQSLMEVAQDQLSEKSSFKDEHDIEVSFSENAAETVHALHCMDESLSCGVNPDGSRWWKETGIEKRPDGVICRWTLKRGVSADQEVEWQDKFWEASDDFGYKELGSEKLGRNATGSVWREYWRESMWQDRGLVHLEKTADKWGKNGNGDEWQEKWWEQYNASGQADKSAHKWCSIDPTTALDAGHAHVWHERWGEKYDGHGGSTKYTDKWAERCEGDAWTKWGDKWDENFDTNGLGVKQGEAWWEGKHGERWNRTWGEGHNGSGWVHKFGKSSSGEHWDTHEQQDTWYERFPHYGFYHCFDNSVQLRQVEKPSDMS